VPLNIHPIFVHFPIALLSLYAVMGLIRESFIVALAALARLIAISITGTLGGAIVYGPDVDLVVSLVYHLLF